MANKIKVITFNVKGLKGPEKRSKVLEWLSQKESDIILIQESHFEESDRDKWRTNWPGKIIASQGTNQSRGVCTLIRKNLDCELKETYRDKEGRWLITVLDIKNVKYCIANYYGPNLDKTEPLTAMLKKLEEVDIDNTILGGDLNFVFNLDLDKSGGNRNTNFKCREVMMKWQKEHDIRDIWRERNPTKRQYTWCSNSKPRIQCRLDHLIISQQLSGIVSEVRITPGYSSDHSLVYMTMTTTDSTRGKGFWKFNASLLKDDEFDNRIKETINNTILDNTPCSARLLWDITKCNIRRECIAYGCKMKKERNREEKILEARIDQLEGVINQDPSKEKEREEELQTIRSELDQIIQHKCRGAALRSKCKNYEYGEKASKYFMKMESQQGEKQSIKNILREDGSITSDQTEILEEQYSFYKKLYNKKDEELEGELEEEWNHLFKLNSNKVDEDDHPEMVKRIEEEEIRRIIAGSPNDKSPGIDGLSNEFYKHFWEDIKHILIPAYNEALQEGELCISQKRGAISLLPKEGKDIRMLKNWRPITLLNNDYKYLAKALALRCRNILPYIIGKDQCGFVKGRLIGFNIIRLLDIIETCKVEDISGLLVNIDIEKAFDSVSWRFLQKSLEFFNIPKDFIEWIKCLYKGAEVCTMNNGNSSRFIQLGRGMRQGCPLSPTLFVICIEMMSIYIHNCQDIQGLNLYNEEHLISQFADDTSFFINQRVMNLEALFDKLRIFGDLSGLQVNVDKTEIFRLGNETGEQLPENYRHLEKKQVKILGCKVDKNLEDTIKTNYSEAFEKMEKSLKFWSKKPLSLIGKINMLKCQIIPKMLYCMTILPSPTEEYWKKVEKEFYTFISNNKKEKLKRTALINTYEKGGAQMMDIKSQNKAVKGMWLLKAALMPGPWTFRLRHHVGNTALEYIVNGNTRWEEMRYLMPKDTIWEEAGRNWCEVNFRNKNEVEKIDDIVSESLWFNSNIMIKGMTLYKEKWAENGISQIWDILGEDQRTILTYREFSERYQMKTTFLEYGGLRKAIPGEWKRLLRDSDKLPDLDNAQENIATECSRKRLKSSTIYRKILAKKATGPMNKIEKWKEELRITEDTDVIIKAMETTRKGTVYTKLQSYNYNFFHRNLVYEARLHKMGLEENNLCKHCRVKESLVHLYWVCPETKKLWESLNNRVYKNTTVEMSKKTCLLNIFEERSNETRTLGVLNLVCRYYIHIMKCKGTKSSQKGLWATIKNISEIEKTIETERGRKKKHDLKWDMIN
jgi:exonuclease III